MKAGTGPEQERENVRRKTLLWRMEGVGRKAGLLVGFCWQSGEGGRSLSL